MRSKILFVTPYFKESPALLKRCADSVKSQNIECDHMFISDGYPSDFIATLNVRHLILDRNYNDYGNTPRGIGCMLGIAENYDAIGILDADNWLEPCHVEMCLQAAGVMHGGTSAFDYVIAKRFFRRPDESIMPIAEEDDHVDTNCFFFLPGSYDILRVWMTMPNVISKFSDRIFYAALKSQNRKFVLLDQPTVNYHDLWIPHYLFLNEVPPADAKQAVQDSGALASLIPKTMRELEIINRRFGYSFFTAEL